MTTKRKSPPPPEPLQIINVGDPDFIQSMVKAKRPRHRAPTAIEVVQAKMLPAMRVVELERDGLKRKSAVAQAAKELRCTTRKVEHSLAFCKLTRQR